MQNATQDNRTEPHVEPVPGSFRDPSGFVFRHEGVIYRQINRVYADHYRELMESGLYAELTGQGLLIPHREVPAPVAAAGEWYRTIRPEPLSLISHPHEWCFSQLRDAALLTLEIQRQAMEHEMTLKDASAFNVQFHNGRPVFIDTLSFEPYIEGRPWVAYRQFCQHFLGPLALMSRTDIRLAHLQRAYIDGLPLDLVSRLLPSSSWLSPRLMMHVHLHARTQKALSDSHATVSDRARRLSHTSRYGLIGIIESLRAVVRKLEWTPAGTEWGEYYSDTNYSDESFGKKKTLIAQYLDRAAPSGVWDLGGNTGLFTRLASDRGIPSVCFDIDPAAVEANYREIRRRGETTLCPLLLDLTNPGGGLGWAATERSSVLDRGPVDCVMALALIHHLCIANNVPLGQVAALLAGLTREYLIIEFVPREDSQVQRLLRSREDIFSHYHEQGFEEAFLEHFTLESSDRVSGSLRKLYLLRRR